MEEGASAALPSKKKGKKKQKHDKDSKTAANDNKATPKTDIFSRIQDPPYEDYLNKEDVSHGLKRGELVKGTLRINQRDYLAAYVDDPNGGPDYYIPELWARNRALDGDEVVIQVSPPDKWESIGSAPAEERILDKILSSLKLVDTKEDKGGTNIVTPTIDTPTVDTPTIDTPTIDTPITDTSSTDTPTADDKCDTNQQTTDPINAGSGIATPLEDTPTRPTLIDALYFRSSSHKGKNSRTLGRDPFTQDGKDLRKFKRTAKVIYIINKVHSRACAGIIKVYNKTKGVSLFSPTDGRVPRVVVPLTDLPPDYTQNHVKYQTTLFICRIIEWTNNAPFPSGQLLRSLGEAGEIEPETASVLTEYQVDDEEFPQEVLDCLPKLEENKKWTAPQEELKKRRDFRQDCVVSIDPSTARDLDDALHCKEISPGVYEVGVHIADVSHFIDPKTPLDKMAADRATSVYLVQRVIPMLPRQLCENLCSLNPHEEKLTFSVVWQLTLKGELVNEWMGKSVICSRAKLSYEEAQQMIDDPGKDWSLNDFPNVADQKSIPDVVTSVVVLNKIAKHLRFLREKRGTLRLDQPKLCFTLDKATGLPNGCRVYQHKESNKLIEEFMLLANMAVAQKISKCFPSISLLRRHPSPKARAVENLRDQCKIIGVVLDFSSAGNLQKSLAEYSVTRCGNESVGVMEKQLLTNLCCKIMELARYFCTGCIEDEDDYLHYALNVPKYTHFTSPIRRYADVVVHRLLAAALDEGPLVASLSEDVNDQAQQCNKKRRNAKIVEEFSGNLFLGVFIRECGPLYYQGMVQAVLNKSLDVYIPQLAVIKRIYFEKLPLSEFKYEPPSEGKEPSVALVWKEGEGVDRKNQVQVFKVFSPVNVILLNRNKTLQFDAQIKPPEKN